MPDDVLERLGLQYAAYVDAFRVDGALPPMMELKRVHTAHVVENAKLIAAGENFDPRTAAVCELAALFHDTGRYEQLKRYNTFRDSDSVDHAVFSHAIVKEKGWLDVCPAAERQAILDAILFHNRRELPERLDPLTAAAAQAVRDADKLDIFRVLEDQIATTDWRHDCQAFWNLPTTARPGKAVLEAIRAGRPVDYQSIASLADFVLIQVGWMISGLAYGTSRRLVRERGHLEFRRDFLHRLTDDPAVDELCDRAAGGAIPRSEGPNF
ncbi:MAG: HD domain-containing protein [Kiritimatiellia bacterium]